MNWLVAYQMLVIWVEFTSMAINPRTVYVHGSVNSDFE